MAVQAMVSVVLQKLTDMLTEESATCYYKVVVKDLNEMKEALEETLGFLIEAEDKLETDDEVKDWASKYLKSLCDVEDVIETFAVSIERQRKKKLGFLMNSSLFFNNFPCRKLRSEVKKIVNKMKELNLENPSDQPRKCRPKRVGFQDSRKSDSGATRVDTTGIAGEDQRPEKVEEKQMKLDTNGEFEIVESNHEENQYRQKVEEGEGLEETTEESETVSVKNASCGSWSEGEHRLQPKLLFSYSYGEEHLGMVENAIKEGVRCLVGRLTEERDFLIPVVGKAGSGKTTLARAVYGIRNIRLHFECRAWVYVSKEYSKRDLLLSLLNQIGTSKNQRGFMTEPCLETRLTERLKEKRYLIVLDNVWKSEIWYEIKNVFQDTGNGSKIVFTTSDDFVANYPDLKDHKHSLAKLTDPDSWNMFLKKAGLTENSPLITGKRKKKILEICNGLPLHIVLLSGLLFTKKESNNDEWSSVLFGQNYWNREGILSLSYRDLRVHSKLCLLYLALFPKEFDIPVRRLLGLWLAEGFVKRSPAKDPEDMVEGYFKDLVSRNLIQISKSRSDGSPKRCRLLGALHDYLLPKAKDISLFHIHRILDKSEDVGPFGVRRLVEYADIKMFSLDTSQLQYLRSYLSFNFQKKDTPARDVGRFVGKITESGFGLLRVLDLEGVYKPNLPEKLGHLSHLRYLGLRWTFLDTLPPSVGDLPYLETLDLKHTYINSLPQSIWKLKHLRHMNLNEIRLDMPMQPRKLLTGLLTLWGLFVDDEKLVTGGLDRLRDLRELGITFRLRSSLDLVDWIANLTALQSLTLRSKDDKGCPSKLGWKTLSSLDRLTHLKLLGNLERLPARDAFPPRVKVLTLSVSKLKDDPMPTLSQLPSLTVLRLLANSYVGEKMVCPSGGFGKLRVLKLWMLKNLEKWHVEEGAMQGLKELNIRCCHRLKNIPDRLLKLETLEELVITSMPKEFTAEVNSSRPEHMPPIVNNWEFTPLPWEKDDEGCVN